jgi:hypothetical protein
MVYNGDRDMSVAAVGSELLLNKMIWKGAKTWLKSARGLWTVEDQVAGYAKSHMGLDFIVVYNSGHLVPYNQPAFGLDLITRFVKNESFSDFPLPSFEPKFKLAPPSPGAKPDLPVAMIVCALALAFAAGWLGSAWSQKRRFRNEYQPV